MPESSDNTACKRLRSGSDTSRWMLSITLGWLLAASAIAADTLPVERDRQLIGQRLAELAPQQAGRPDLFVIGFAGDGSETVFRNEVRYLETLMDRRFGAGDRTLTLINHPESLDAEPRPLATLDNLRAALAGIGALMDPDEDILFLFMTTHGSRDHRLSVYMPPLLDEGIDPKQLRQALDASGIRHRVIVVSACFSGGFVPALSNPDTLVITAAHATRTSFGCGSESNVTYFGDALLVDGLNRSTDFLEAFESARQSIGARERKEGHAPSVPQLNAGHRIRERLDAWQETLDAGPAVPYPYR